MKIYKEETSTIIRQRIVNRKCDLCGEESKTSNWDADYWGINETEVMIIIKQKEGSNYPEGGSGIEYEIDLCPHCFCDRLILWLKSEGATIKEIKWNTF